MLALTRPALAEPTNIPDCTKYTLPDGRVVCGYVNIEDWKNVLRADAELTAGKDLLRLEREKVVELRSQIDSFRGQVAAYERALSVLKQRNRELTVDLLETDRKYQNERVKPKWGNPLAWATAGLAAAALGGYILSDTL